MVQEYTIVGYKECLFYQMALAHLASKNLYIHTMAVPRATWPTFIQKLHKLIGNHRTSPLVFYGNRFIGGYDELKRNL